MNELHVFSGDGGGILGGLLLGDVPVCAVEINPRCRETLLQRQRDGILPWFPIWDCVKTFDGKPWRGIARIVSGGFPCTDISAARTNNHVNGKQRGLDGESSGLWSEMARIIGEVQPEIVRIENSPNLRTKGLVRVLKDLDGMGYDAKWGVFQCRNFGADHIRRRVCLVAKHSHGPQQQGGGLSSRIHQENTHFSGSDWWKNQPGLERVANGMPSQMERLKAIWFLAKHGSPMPKPRKPLPKRSKGMAVRMSKYNLARQVFLENHPFCEVCNRDPSIHVHHKQGRGRNLLNEATWLAVCFPCHDRIHCNPAWGYATGLLLKRV